MGGTCCTAKKQDLNEIQIHPYPQNEKVKRNILNDLNEKLNDLGFNEFVFVKNTNYELSYDSMAKEWNDKQEKVYIL